MRLYLGELHDDQFTQTIESIKFLDEESARLVRKELRFLVTEVINPKKKEKKKLNEMERYLKSLKDWQEKHDRENKRMKERIKYFNPDFLL